MLRRLRMRLTMICTLATCVILASMAAICLYISESRLSDRSTMAFQSNINSIVYRFQASRIIDNGWLSQMEAGNRLIIYIEDNSKPLSYSGSWKPKTDRQKLISTARDQALNQYMFDINTPPLSSIDISTVMFTLEGENNDRYQAAAAVVPSADGWQSLILLHDMSLEDADVMSQRFMFVVLVLFSTMVLAVFSWWFAGRAIGPVEDSTRRQTEFVAAASHELRTPLAVIRTSAAAVETTHMTPESQRFIDTIESECTRMARLVDDLLLLAGSDTQRWSLYTEQVEPETIITQSYENFEPAARDKNQHLTLTLPDEPMPVISGDSQRIKQVLAILIDNALFYTQPGGTVSIGANIAGRYLKIYVRDNGPGISDEDKVKIFERFYRADKSRSKKEHYGLGLSIASEIAGLHGGKIYVTDTDGGGSTFILELPRQ